MLATRVRRAWGAALVGGAGALVGLVAVWLSGPEASGTHPLLLAAGSCLLGLWGAHLAWGRRYRLAALLLLEGAAGLGVGIGEAGLIPGTLLLLAALLAWLGR